LRLRAEFDEVRARRIPARAAPPGQVAIAAFLARAAVEDRIVVLGFTT
jgi:hypothetical protein